MTRFGLASVALGLLAFGSLLAAEPKDGPKIEDVVKFEFPKDGYTFTLAEAAKGIKLEYRIVVAQEIAGVIVLPLGRSSNPPPGPSGLQPDERIAGNNQFYGLIDFGLMGPRVEVVQTIKKNSYVHTFAWDGRNWSGPSDINIPKGKPFPAGTYEVSVTLFGKQSKGKDKVPYEIVGKAKLVLKP